jgi:branched-chain amino acid transport system ATP-binding protein
MSETILEVRDLYKHFGGLVVNSHCNLDVTRGEIHALIGPNGAGKTTMIAQIAGMLKPDGGRIIFDGADITRLPVHARVDRGLARTFQITSIFPGYTVLDNLALSVQARRGSSFRFWRPRQAERELFEAAAEIADAVGLSRRLQTPAGTLAHGEQRRLEIGLALACDAKLLLLDEPMAGIGADESGPMIELIRRVRSHAAILLVEHDMDAVFQLADRISVLVYGELIATGTPAAIRANERVHDAYLGQEEPDHG